MSTRCTSKKPIRIAHIIGKMAAGGVEAVVFNYYRHIDHEKFQFDFFYDADSSVEPPKGLIDMGARFFVVPPYQKLPSYLKALRKYFREYGYQMVHAHINTLNIFPLFAAWREKVPVRIAHNHSTAAKGEGLKNALKYTFRPLAKLFPTHLCACSQFAAEWAYGKKCVSRGEVHIIQNAVDVSRFEYNEEKREAKRLELGLREQCVIGHVGRFVYQKNHAFLIDIFKTFHDVYPNSVLLLVGDGPLKGETESKVRSLQLEGAVFFLGVRNDVNELYQAMDVFVLPSFYEGLPVVGVEAQVAGLPCIFSSSMTKESKVATSTCFLPLSAGAEAWAEVILEAKNTARTNGVDEIISHGYEIKSAAEKLETWYEHRLAEINGMLPQL